MADQGQSTGGGNKFINSVAKGLNTDTSPSTQPEGTYRWALNAMNESVDGDLGFLTNEFGNYECGEIGNDWAVIGHVYIEDDEAIAFLAPKDASFASPYHGWGRIVRIKKDCTVEVLLTADCLNFKINHQIQAIVRVRNGCELNLYWTDNFNDIRHINLDSLIDYVIYGKEDYLKDHPAGSNNDYRLSPYDHHDDSSLWDCENMKLFPDFTYPCIEFVELNDSGGLPAGVYQFAVQYLDQDFNPTNWTDLTQPIPVYDDPIGSGDLGIKGSNPGNVNQDGSTATGFAVDGNQTSKSIVLRFTNLDLSFKFLRVAVWPSTGGIGSNVEGGRLVMEIPITDTVETFSFGEYNPTTTTYLSRDELTVDKKVFNKAKSIAQHSNRLLLAGTEELTIDHIALQRAAQNIEITYTTETLDAEDSTNVSSVSGKYYFDYRPYMRDEIYSFAIVFYYKDGTTSPAYHIPGREMNRSAANSRKWSYDLATDTWSYGGAGPGLITDGDYNVPGALNYTMGQHNRPVVGSGGWDSDVIVTASNFSSTNNMNVHHYDPNNEDINPELIFPYNRGDGHIHRWEVYNTAVREQQMYMDGEYITKGQMGYYECRNYVYPDTRDCNGVPIYPHQDLGNGLYAMHFVRHHKMPDTTLEPHFYGARTIQNSNIGDRGDNPFGVGMDVPRTVTLGIEANNVQIPSHLADLIQGFKIVKARTEETDRTVIDKGLMYYTIIAGMSWQGRQVEEERMDPSQCGFQFQAGQFNKHIASFACVHMSAGGNSELNSGDYATDYATFLGFGDDGTTTILADNYYWLNFDETGYHFQGFVPWNGRSQNCIVCPNNEDEDKYQHMLPMIMTHLEFDYYDDANGDNNVSDQISRGNGYPLGFWGWRSPDKSDFSVDAGVNIGYWTEQIVWPCAVQGYHGPLSKFGTVAGAQYIKVERIILGYNRLILCNNACCVNDIANDASTHATGTFGGGSGNMRSGIGAYSAGRDDGNGGDGGTTYIYSRMSYQQSVVPPNNMQNAISNGYTGSSPQCHSTGDSGSCTWLWLNNAMYNNSLTNVRLEDYVKIEHNSGQHFIPTMGWAPFSNDDQQQETLLMIGYTKGRTDARYPFAFPYPYHCPGFTPTGYDQSWSRRACHYLEGGNGSNEGLGTAYYVSLKKKAYDAYGAIGSLLYHPTHNCLVYTDAEMPSVTMNSGPLYGGDSFVSRFAFKMTSEHKRCATGVRGSRSDDCVEEFADGDGTQTPAYSGWAVRERESGDVESRHAIYNNIVWYWTESWMNTELRLGNDSTGERIYPYHFEGVGGGGSFGTLSFVDDSMAHDRGAAYSTDAGGEDQTANYYALNNDYNKVNTENIYSPLPLQYDFCADCQEHHPFRLSYSEQTFQEEQRDRYKSFLANNYKDIPAHRGIIWNMFTLNNSVYIHTAESMWRIDPSRNVVSPADGERSVYIGTGDFFSNEIQEILQSDHGYLGCQSQWATMQTESGTFWPDERQGHIFLQQQNPKDLTNVGMKAWFENNMNINIYDQYQEIYNVDFPFIDNPANPAGAGYVATYDIRHNRFIVTKRDYKLIAPWNTTDPASPYYHVIEADPYSGNWVVSGGAGANCDCQNNPLWENYDNYSVQEITNSLTGLKECEHTWTQTTTSTYTESIPSDTDIWVFYDTTSMSTTSGNNAKAAINTWVANEQGTGGMLENWSGNIYHMSTGGEQWIRWPLGVMTGAPPTTGAAAAFGGYNSSFGNSSTFPGTSDNALVICLIDESNSGYHGTGGASGGGAKTSTWNTDVAAFKAAWTAHTGGGGICDTLVLAVAVYGTSTDNAKDDFIRHAFCAIHGNNITNLPVHTNGNPISPYANANSEQINVPSAGPGFVSLSNCIPTNPYDGDDPLYDYGVRGRYDRRQASDFNSVIADDIGDFVSAQTVEHTVTTTNDFKQITPCNWENMMDTGSDICSTCGDNNTASPFNITLNDNTVAVINNLNEIFECGGWTASFNVGLNQWISFHSYMPHYYIPMRNYFYSGLNIGAWNVQKGTNIYRHELNSSRNNYQMYYGCIQPFVVDIISNDSPLNVNTYDNFHFITDVSYYDPVTKRYIDDRYITYDSVYLYNDYQITGNLNFRIKDTNVSTMMNTSVTEVNNQIALERKERTWGFNGFRDMAIARGTAAHASLFTSAWSDISTQHWYDKIVNPLAVSTAKPWFERQYLSDKYLGIRLFFSNLAGQGKHKLVANYLYGSAQQNIR